MSGDELKKYGHNLKRLWKAYKQKYPTSDLSGFDSCVKDLQKFENIRYPDAIADKGMSFTISVTGPPPSIDAPVVGVGSTPIYRAVVNDIDQLIRTIFTTSSRNPAFFFARLSTEGRALLRRDNPAFPSA